MTKLNPQDPHSLEVVTIDRVVDAMATFDVTLDKIEGRDDSATANLNGLPCLFAVLDSVVIVRADVQTDAAYSQADAGLFLAANQINSVALGARAVITDFDDQLVVRTERDISIAAGMTDQQLQAALQAAVDGVLGAQNAMVAAAEEMAKLGSAAAAEATEGN
ncbi:YbjN domain-containing protein [Corynebacterium lizhenjunii]|uniref:YbjN domain-containing protein n=1 Tax=Corynebacterium lizhenjunii TaxID=2709394 RepID=A0A7T0PAZ4_9CORY|nr:YbjN domain-containing protein [Corynebacterium lizhenjunii]QPK78207.1 YbjN domain-containing protein [Corynebacterium lizhenjunii]